MSCCRHSSRVAWGWTGPGRPGTAGGRRGTCEIPGRCTAEKRPGPLAGPSLSPPFPKGVWAPPGAVWFQGDAAECRGGGRSSALPDGGCAGLFPAGFPVTGSGAALERFSRAIIRAATSAGLTPGDPAGLAQVQGPDLVQLLPGLQPQPLQMGVVQIRRQGAALQPPELLHLAHLAGDVALVLQADLHLLPHQLVQLRSLGVKGGQVVIAHPGPAQQGRPAWRPRLGGCSPGAPAWPPGPGWPLCRCAPAGPPPDPPPRTLACTA